MALRAGYYGLKNSVKRTLEKLASDMAGAKAIKSIGDGLSLSDQGALAANIDSDTMEFKDHKLAAKITSGYTKDLLYGNETITYPPTQDTSIQLSDAFTDYDVLLVVGGFVSSGVKAVENWIVDAQDLASFETAISNANGKIYVLPFNAGTTGGGQWVRIGQDPEDATHKTLTFVFNGEVGIYKIYGIKF